ncbi:MAG: hypothetical protein VW169_07285 [Rhodospirillaceae bacterium]
MLTFSEWREMTGNQIKLDEARFGKSNWTKGAAVALTARAHHQRNNVKSMSDTNDKLDQIADLLVTDIQMTLLSIATDTQDKSLLKGIRKR